MRALVYTPLLRLLVPAWQSVQAAFHHWREAVPGVRFDHLIGYGQPAGAIDGNERVVAKYQEAQRVFLEGDWDVFIAVEDDMIVPVDVFPRLMAMVRDEPNLSPPADIAYALYAWRLPPHKWSAYTAVDETSAQSLWEDKQAARDAWGRVIDVAGLGLGCTAIRRHVLEAISFQKRGPACNDWYLAVDAQAHLFRQRCHLGLVCGHLILNPAVYVLWPDVTAEGLVRKEVV